MALGGLSGLSGISGMIGGGGGGGSLWTPLSLISLQVWGRADSVSSSPVGSYPDKSGHGHTLTQATGSQQPSWSAAGAAGGQPDLVFTAASQQFLQSGTILANILTGDFAIGTVFRITATGPLQVLVDFGTGAPNYYVDTNRTFNAGIASAGFAFAATATAGTWYSTLLQRSGGTLSHYVGGVADVNSFAAGSKVVANSTLILGANTGPGNYFGGDLPEFFFAAQSLSAADIANWFAYTHARYGV